MENNIEYEKLNTDWSEHYVLDNEQRMQLIMEKIARYKLQSELNYNSWANIIANEY